MAFPARKAGGDAGLVENRGAVRLAAAGTAAVARLAAAGTADVARLAAAGTATVARLAAAGTAAIICLAADDRFLRSRQADDEAFEDQSAGQGAGALQVQVGLKQPAV